MLQDMQLEKSYSKNKRESRNLLPFYQEQCNQLKGITRFMIKNYLQ